jgi:hypothetical protein
VLQETLEAGRRGEPLWLEPYPDVLMGEVADTAPGPEARYETRESISLAFIAALQHLPPRQRATLVLRDVLGFHAAEAASILECSLDAVNRSLKRARANIAGHVTPSTRDDAPPPGSPRERVVVARFTNAFERGDVGSVVALLTDDVSLTMPPLPWEYQGRATAEQFALGRRHPVPHQTTELRDGVHHLLTQAQHQHTIRDDITIADLMVLHTSPNHHANPQRALAVLRDGLRTPDQQSAPSSAPRRKRRGRDLRTTL